MQELIDNLQAEKEQLNCKLKEANIRKIEHRLSLEKESYKESSYLNKN
jgi:hypothetical protein